MTEKKPRDPFKSGDDDFEAIRPRLKEIGTDHGVDLTKKPEDPAAAPYYPDVYA